MTEDRNETRNRTYREAATLKPGEEHYRSFIGTPSLYDVESGMQFQIMLALGLREYDKLLDIGCGSLRGGRLFMSYLRPSHYYGVEPNRWLLEDAIENELGREFIKLRDPSFVHTSDFELSQFDVSFDYILAQSILTHTGRSQLRACFDEVSKALKNNGIFAASFYSNGVDNDGDEWVYPQFVSYTPKFVVDVAKEYGLTAYPLIWPANHGQYWFVFIPSASTRDVSWLGLEDGKPSAFRMIQLQRELHDERTAHAKTRAQLEEDS